VVSVPFGQPAFNSSQAENYLIFKFQNSLILARELGPERVCWFSAASIHEICERELKPETWY
jgi:hypothetical protein